MNNISPLRYPGGKTRACKILDNILNEHFKLEYYTEIHSPFFGGGSFEFHIQNNYSKKLIVNDKFTPLYYFWLNCKNNKEKLCNLLYTYLNIDKETFLKFRNEIINHKDSFYQALYYFIINRCSFSGATLSGGFSLESSKKRFTSSSINRINNLDLSNFEIYNLDFEEFINTNYKNTALMFIDPPYYLEKKSKLYGNYGDLHESFDHDKLYEILKNKKNWLLTYNNCNYITNLYKDFIILEVSWSYGMNKTKESSEIVIISK
jgi:DNA adenine methylase